MSINPEKLKQFVESEFTNNALPSFKTFLTIENCTPAYDPDWDKNGLLKSAASHLKAYALKSSGVQGLNAILSSDEGKTPFLLVTVDSTSGDGKSILLYGHFDKQPPNSGWSQGLGPYLPVEKDGYLYGRGSADDGYAFYAMLTIIKALQNFNIPHPKFVIILEGSEESGSIDLPIYIEEYQQFIGQPDLILALDSGIIDYNRIWLTSSLRGVVSCDLTVKTLTKGVHSGKGSGIAPESFMIIRKLLSKLEDYNDQSRMKDFEVEIPDSEKTKISKAVEVMGDDWCSKIPILPGMKLLGDTPTDRLINWTWKPALTVAGARGIPNVKDAGNVLRPYTTLYLSIRTPPTFDGILNGKKILEDITNQTPFNSTVLIENYEAFNGSLIKEPSDNLKSQIDNLAKNYISGGMAQIPVGISIPFTTIFSQYFPKSQILVTGCAGVDSNAHGPNERLNLSYTKNFICSFVHIFSVYKSYL